jgi:hypothetical protein
MVAVLDCSQTRGGRAARAIAAPTARVESTREAMICRRFSAEYRQSTLRPARLRTTSAPSISRGQSPSSVAPSHRTTRHPAASADWRLSITTSWPAATKERARTFPT